MSVALFAGWVKLKCQEIGFNRPARMAKGVRVPIPNGALSPYPARFFPGGFSPLERASAVGLSCRLFGPSSWPFACDHEGRWLQELANSGIQRDPRSRAGIPSQSGPSFLGGPGSTITLTRGGVPLFLLKTRDINQVAHSFDQS